MKLKNNYPSVTPPLTWSLLNFEKWCMDQEELLGDKSLITEHIKESLETLLRSKCASKIKKTKAMEMLANLERNVVIEENFFDCGFKPLAFKEEECCRRKILRVGGMLSSKKNSSIVASGLWPLKGNVVIEENSSIVASDLWPLKEGMLSSKKTSSILASNLWPLKRRNVVEEKFFEGGMLSSKKNSSIVASGLWPLKGNVVIEEKFFDCGFKPLAFKRGGMLSSKKNSSIDQEYEEDEEDKEDEEDLENPFVISKTKPLLDSQNSFSSLQPLLGSYEMDWAPWRFNLIIKGVNIEHILLEVYEKCQKTKPKTKISLDYGIIDLNDGTILKALGNSITSYFEIQMKDYKPKKAISEAAAKILKTFNVVSN
ncbi:hypothetical protein G9A89_008596 [Geosiphon pyriformis]|nr:hypothetical protein G9A89_008596 [Geosiphon pyriformis]